MAPPASYDEADAAILATTVAAASNDRAIFQICDRAEGRFVVALDQIDAAYLRSTSRLTSAETKRLKGG
jgi:hypothetical protein